MVDLSLYSALFKDMVAWRTDLRSQLEGDYERLLRYSERPEFLKRFLMIDLVNAGKIFDKGLSSGRIIAEDLPDSMGMVVSGGGRLFGYSLSSMIFGDAGFIFDDEIDPNSVYFLRQICYLSKKVKEECSDADILEAVCDFSHIDRQLRQPTYGWRDSTRDGFDHRGQRLSFADDHRSRSESISDNGCSRALLLVLDRVCGQLFTQLPEFTWTDLRPAHGPGAVADAKSGSDKYLFPTWPDKLESVFPHSYFARSREDLDIEEPMIYATTEVPARLIAVPKTLKGPRMIASEPTAHQFVQHGLMRWMREHLPRPLQTCIAFRDQTPSQELCLEASRTGTLATVDLSSASDRLSCWVVERAFQYNWKFLEALWASRTQDCRVAVKNVDGKLIGEEDYLFLAKFAPMGSGVTFPVQTVIYAAAAIAAIIYDSGKDLKVTSRKIRAITNRIRVYGDDIILPSSSVSTLYQLLHYLELKVNASKTHWQGLFRESCGLDAYAGHDVTPTYLRAFCPGKSSEDIVSWVSVCNNAHSAGLFNLAKAMFEKLPKEMRFLIPVSSIKEPLACLTATTFCTNPPNNRVARRWNSKLQRQEVLALVPSAKQEWKQRDGYQSLLQYFIEEPSPLVQWQAGTTGRQRLRLRKQWVYDRNASWTVR